MTRDNSNKLRAVFLAALMFLWLFAGTVAFTGGAAASTTEFNTQDGTIDGVANLDGEEFWQGQTQQVNLNDTQPIGVNIGESLSIREVTDRSGGTPTSVSSTVANPTVRENDTDNTVFFNIRTSQLSQESYVVRYGGSSDYANNDTNAFNANLAGASEFEVSVQNLDTEFEDDEVRSGESTEFTMDSNRGNYNVTVTEADEDLDEDELSTIFQGIVDDGFADSVNITDDDEIEIRGVDDFVEDAELTFTDIDEGDYEFDFDVVDSTAESNASITVLGEVDADASFDEAQVEQNRGDIVDINATVEGSPDEVDIVFGDIDDSGYQANITVELDDDNDDQVALRFNTRNAGLIGGADFGDTDNTNASMIVQARDDLGEVTDFSQDTEDSAELNRVLQDGLYDVEIREGNTTNDVDVLLDDEDEYDVMTVDLLERSTDDINMWRAPTGSLGDFTSVDDVEAWVEAGNITETDEIAMSDRSRSDRSDVIVHQIEVSGIQADASDGNGFGDLNTSLLLNSTNFTLEYEQQSPQANREPFELNTSETAFDDMAVIHDEETNNYYVAAERSSIQVDRGGEARILPTDREFEASFNVTASYLDNFTRDSLESPDDDEVVSAEFDTVDRELDFDTVDDEIVVPASEDANITGDTNIAPGTEINIRTRATGDGAFLRTANDVRVDGDGEFAGMFDFSDRSAGQEFTASVRQQGFDDDAATDGVIGELEGPVFTVSDLEPQDAEVDQGDMIDVSATITNEGDEDGNQTVSLTLDGDELDSQEVELDEGDDTTVEFTDVDTSELEGTYEHAIETEDDSASGTLTVNVDDADDEEVPTDDDEAPTDDDEAPTDDDEAPTDDDEVPTDDAEPEDQVGFGAVVALIALLAAALIAARRNALNN